MAQRILARLAPRHGPCGEVSRPGRNPETVMATLEPIASSETDQSACARRMRDPRPGETLGGTPAPRETTELLVDSGDNAGRLFRAGTLFVALFNVLVMVS